MNTQYITQTPTTVGLPYHYQPQFEISPEDFSSRAKKLNNRQLWKRLKRRGGGETSSSKARNKHNTRGFQLGNRRPKTI